MQNDGNKRKNFFDVLEDFLNKDLKDLGKEMRDFGKDFKKDFQHNWGRDFVKSYPLLNVVETAEKYRVDLAVPGLQKENFKVSLKENELKIWADVEISLNEGEKYRKREYNFGKFQRTFTLPEDVEADKIEAKYENGILSVHLPKKAQETDENEREIKID